MQEHISPEGTRASPITRRTSFRLRFATHCPRTCSSTQQLHDNVKPQLVIGQVMSPQHGPGGCAKLYKLQLCRVYTLARVSCCAARAVQNVDACRCIHQAARSLWVPVTTYSQRPGHMTFAHLIDLLLMLAAVGVGLVARVVCAHVCPADSCHEPRVDAVPIAANDHIPPINRLKGG